MYQSSLLKKPAITAMSSTPGHGPLLQCKSAPASSRGGSSIEASSGISQPRFGHTFADIQIHPSGQAAPVDGSLSVHPSPEEGSIFMDDQPKDKPKSQPAKPPENKPDSKPEKAKAACPPTIEVAQVIDAELTEDNVKAGYLTGVGGVAEIRVSDPTGKDWAGTVIHENLTPKTNTCTGMDNCTNTGGVGGGKGSTWKVGEAATGLVNLSAKKNTFYDVHLTMTKNSVLHDNKLESCVQTCEQFFDCPGVGRIGNKTFTIKRELKKGTLGGKGVSLITLTVS
ncbi:MAG TPA: hypothetical protein VMI53_01045 [Opitutaceae bacterium]|nr:hypothetical protein [Opitutaceae bacterium]